MAIKSIRRFPFLLLATLLIAPAAHASDVKEADLAGSWYPSSGAELSKLLRGYLDSADPEKVEGKIFAIIAPHAGYQFSAPVAAYSYKLAAGQAGGVRTVVILGFSHRKPFDGIAIYDKGSFRTPLGEIAVDVALAKSIESYDKRIRFIPGAFSGENSIETQIPFIQIAFRNASIVPVAFGTQAYRDAEILADALAKALKGRTDCLVVASTDLSHYHGYDEANVMDDRFAGLIGKAKPDEIYADVAAGRSEACGVMPIVSTLLAAGKLGFGKAEILKYANSGDTYGDKSRVVGYLSAVIYGEGLPAPETRKDNGKDSSMLLNDAQRKRLLEIARESIAGFVGDGKRRVFTEDDPLLNKPFGAFVTLHENGQLRGCIGNMAAQGKLYQTVADMAIEAATGDPRFSRLSPDEIGKIDIEISVLTPLERVSSADEITIPGNGVVVRRGFRSGVYLPQVATEAGWGKEEFLTSLCAHKAGLAPDAWKDPQTELYTFNAEVFGEKRVAE